ncbi:MAG: DNA translocase FtsK, partial [Calditrichia bacterium]|nr:DNA translocase FtsK [Calditrichia bacterium]
SVNVITGVIKTNFPVRIAYQVPQKIDSKVILDLLGAEQLIGKGDMLLKSPAFPKPIRLQTPLIEAVEVDRIVKHIKKQPHFPPYELQLPAKGDGIKSMKSNSDFIDPLFEDARKIVILHKTGSASLLQRKLRIGYTRAASILDQLEDSGIVGPSLGSKAREVYVEKLDDF